jgi:cytidylate kinase
MRPFTIALSRQVGARGTTVASAIGERLNWPVYDQELLVRIAQEMKLRVDLLKSVDERNNSWLLECVQAFATVPQVSASAFVLRLIETVLSLGAHGECVIVGRGATHILPAATTLRVRLVAALKDRIEFMRQERGLSLEEAKRYVDRVEQERVAFIKDHFQHDPTDPLHYDLVLNSSRLSVDECADLVVRAVQRLQAREAMTARSA